MIENKRNQLLPNELCLHYSGHWRSWSRVLFMERDGSVMVEINLTPIDPSKKDNWVGEVFGLIIRAHRTAVDTNNDRVFRCVQKNRHSVAYHGVREQMLRMVPIEVVHRLMCEDFLSEIDWARYTEAQQRPSYRGGGIPFASCKVLHSASVL